MQRGKERGQQRVAKHEAAKAYAGLHVIVRIHACVNGSEVQFAEKRKSSGWSTRGGCCWQVQEAHVALDCGQATPEFEGGAVSEHVIDA